jgi:hypothetical protein
MVEGLRQRVTLFLSIPTQRQLPIHRARITELLCGVAGERVNQLFRTDADPNSWELRALEIVEPFIGQLSPEIPNLREIVRDSLHRYVEQIRRRKEKPTIRETDTQNQTGGDLIKSVHPRDLKTHRETFILRAMEKKGISDWHRLATKAKVDPSTVWRWVKGKNTKRGRRSSDARTRILRTLDLRESDVPE